MKVGMIDTFHTWFMEVYGFIIRGSTLLFLVEVRGHERFTAVKTRYLEKNISQCRKGG